MKQQATREESTRARTHVHTPNPVTSTVNSSLGSACEPMLSVMCSWAHVSFAVAVGENAGDGGVVKGNGCDDAGYLGL